MNLKNVGPFWKERLVSSVCEIVLWLEERKSNSYKKRHVAIIGFIFYLLLFIFKSEYTWNFLPKVQESTKILIFVDSVQKKNIYSNILYSVKFWPIYFIPALRIKQKSAQSDELGQESTSKTFLLAWKRLLKVVSYMEEERKNSGNISKDLF